MKFLKTNYGRALRIPSNTTIPIPHPAGQGMSGITDGTVAANNLYDGDVTFTTNLIGGIVISEGGGIANIVGLIDSNELILDADIASASGTSYKIYSQTPHEGFSIYIPKGEVIDVEVVTIGGDQITLNKIGDLNASMILPIQCLSVYTGSDGLIALW
jgi:hypothetical protein